MIAANVAQWFMFAPFVWFAALFVLFLLRVLLRKEWAAAVAWVVLFSVLGGTGPTGLVITVIFSCLAVFVMIRFGLLALVINEIVFNIVQCFPPDKRGGLNQSTQHSGRTRLALKTEPKSLARVKSAGTLPG